MQVPPNQKAPPLGLIMSGMTQNAQNHGDLQNLHRNLPPCMKMKNEWLVVRVLCPIIIIFAHMASFRWWSDQDQTVAHFRDHLKSTIVYNWTLFEKQVANPNTPVSHHIREWF